MSYPKYDRDVVPSVPRPQGTEPVYIGDGWYSLDDGTLGFLLSTPSGFRYKDITISDHAIVGGPDGIQYSAFQMDAQLVRLKAERY